MKEVIILGRGASRKLCPFDAEVWATISVIALPEMADKAISKVFAFDPYPRVKEGLDIALSRGIPIVAIRDFATEPYPFDEIVEEFGAKFFRITISFMLAYAIYLGYEKIRLYGVDQGPEWGWLVNKPFVTFWLGVATGRGILWENNKASLLHRVMEKEIKEGFAELVVNKRFPEIARADREPYCFISGVDAKAVKVRVTYDMS